MATDDSWVGVSGQWSVCGWSMVQLDHVVKMGPMYGTLQADLEEQRTVERVELAAFFVSSRLLTVL